MTRTSDAGIIFEFDCGSSLSLGVRPRGDDTLTWFRGNTYHGGFDYTSATASCSQS